MTSNITILIPITDKRERNHKQLDDLLTSISVGGYEEVTILALYDATTLEFVEYFQEKYPFLKAIYNTGNPLKFTRNVNVGLRWVLKEQPENHIIIVNQDCILPRWEYLKQIESSGISTPYSENVESIPDLLEKTVWLNATSNVERVREEIKDKIPFYCVFLNNKVLKKVGLLDGALRVCFSDDSYCAKVLLAGFTITKVNIAISHIGTHIDMTKDGESGSGSYNNQTLGKELAQFLSMWQCPVSHSESMKWILENHTWTETMRES